MSDNGQIEFQLARHHRVSLDVDRLRQWLIGRGWRKAKEISVALYFNERYSRRLASDSSGEIISGQCGYKLTCESTMEEVQHSVNFLRSQADQMRERSMAIDRVWRRRKSDSSCKV